MKKIQKRKIAIYLKEKGGIPESIKPKNGKTFSLKELQEYIGGSKVIDIQNLPKSNRLIILDDNGKIEGRSENDIATKIWKEEYPISEFPFNNDESIVGNVIISDPEFIK